MLPVQMQNHDAVRLLAEINERLKLMQALTFDEMSPERQLMAFRIAVDKASLAEVVERNETDPYIAELRRAEEQAETQSSITRAKVAGYDGIDELRKQVDAGDLGAKVAKSAFDKNRRKFGP